MPDFEFTDPAGKKATLANFAGRPLLVNLWATFCGPCITEMPQLDGLSATYAKDGLQVVTISQDSAGADKVTAFFAKHPFKSLHPWMDSDNNFGFHYATGLLPTSVLYSADGREIARITGAMDWNSKDAQNVIEEAINGG
ncbi:MAG: TlpA disulfide reductase family protein [Sphingobium sp.]